MSRTKEKKLSDYVISYLEDRKPTEEVIVEMIFDLAVEHKASNNNKDMARKIREALRSRIGIDFEPSSYIPMRILSVIEKRFYLREEPVKPAEIPAGKKFFDMERNEIRVRKDGKWETSDATEERRFPVWYWRGLWIKKERRQIAMQRYDMIERKGKITLLVNRDDTTIEIVDEKSGVTLLKVTMTPEQCNAALSRLGRTDCELELTQEWERAFMTRTVVTERVPLPKASKNLTQEERAALAITKAEMKYKGMDTAMRCGGSQDSFTHDEEGTLLAKVIVEVWE